MQRPRLSVGSSVIKCGVMGKTDDYDMIARTFSDRAPCYM
jgi:hypothetical protein